MGVNKTVLSKGSDSDVGDTQHHLGVPNSFLSRSTPRISFGPICCHGDQLAPKEMQRWREEMQFCCFLLHWLGCVSPEDTKQKEMIPTAITQRDPS